MGNCSTCSFWMKPAASYGGLCECPKIRESTDRSDHENDALVYSYNEGGSFWTGPHFGCVHHRSKQK